MSFLGIDLGTSGLRALLTDDAGKTVHCAEVAYETATPKPGWSEQDPQLWIDALETVMLKLRDTVPHFDQLRGIGVAGHMHGATFLDRDGKVLRPCILWNDTRAADHAHHLDQKPEFREISGHIVFPGFTAPKLSWMAEHEPEICTKIAKVLLPAGFINFYLTGSYIADVSDSAGTSWLNIHSRDWSNDLLAASGVRRDQMPDLVEGCRPAGFLRHTLQEKWGFQNEIVIAGGAGDNAAAACGIGAIKEGQGFVSLGTSGVVIIARDECHPAPKTAVHTFCHALPNRWYQMGVMLSATDSLNWLSTITEHPPKTLTQMLPQELQPPGPITFMPYLSGERTPHNDANVCGGFFNISRHNNLVDLTKAVLEGVAFGLRDSLEALRKTGARPERLYAIGGGARSEYWLRLIATVLGVSILVPKDGDFGSALGSARLARIATTGEDISMVMTTATVAEIIEPDVHLADAFDEAYRNFVKSYGGYRGLTK